MHGCQQKVKWKYKLKSRYADFQQLHKCYWIFKLFFSFIAVNTRQCIVCRIISKRQKIDSSFGKPPTDYMRNEEYLSLKWSTNKDLQQSEICGANNEEKHYNILTITEDRKARES